MIGTTKYLALFVVVNSLPRITTRYGRKAALPTGCVYRLASTILNANISHVFTSRILHLM